jgi:excisionase family DNA binding protein
VAGRLLTTREVADRLALSPATVLRRWRAGELPGFRLASNVLRFDADELDAWLLDRRGGAYPRVLGGPGFEGSTRGPASHHEEPTMRRVSHAS